MENDMKDLKPIEEMISFLKEGGKYLSCPKCGFLLSKETTIDGSNIYIIINYLWKMFKILGSVWEINRI